VDVAVVTVTVEDPLPVIDVGLKRAVALGGKPAIVKPTLPVNPFRADVETVYVALPPTVTVCELGEAAMEKLGSAPMISVTSVV
jgi:hypothetical protein